jgi:hypothetical protein
MTDKKYTVSSNCKKTVVEIISDTARQYNISQGDALCLLVETGWESTKKQPLNKHSESPISSEVHERLERLEEKVTTLLGIVLRLHQQDAKIG